MKEAYQISLSYACGGIEVENNVITKTAPIFNWMLGKSLNIVQTWVFNKKGSIIQIKSKKSKLINKVKIKSKLPKPIIKFNNGIGAILCNKCRVIIKENLTKDEINGKTDLIWCNKCIHKELQKILDNL